MAHFPLSTICGSKARKQCWVRHFYIQSEGDKVPRGRGGANLGHELRRSGNAEHRVGGDDLHWA
jgi:hypothetical protein